MPTRRASLCIEKGVGFTTRSPDSHPLVRLASHMLGEGDEILPAPGPWQGLIISWTPKGSRGFDASFTLYRNGHSEELSGEPISESAALLRADLGYGPLAVLASCQPFTRPISWLSHPSAGIDTLYTPYFGWHAGSLYDGWTGHTTPDGCFASLIPPGSPLRLRLNYPSHIGSNVAGQNSGLSWQSVHSQMPAQAEITRQCLVSILRLNLSGIGMSFTLEQLALDEAMLLILLRQAFPAAEFGLIYPGNAKLWPRAWRRLTSSLGFGLGQTASAAAVALRAVKELLGEHLSNQELIRLLSGPHELLAGIAPRSLFP